MADGVRMQQRRATSAEWDASSYVLAAGELGVTTDTGIIKIGDGVNAWTDLDAAFDSQFLPLLGKAADSELLDGVSVDSLVKLVDATTTATANKVALRDSDAQLKAAAGTAADDVVNLSQLQSQPISRTVTAPTTLLITDPGSMVLVDHVSITAQVVVTIPTNTTAAIPIGSWIDVVAIGAGGAKLTPAGGVTLTGPTNVYPNYNTIRLHKSGTNTWFGVYRGGLIRTPCVRAIRTGSGLAYGASTEVAVPLNSFDATQSYNPDDEFFAAPPSGLATGRRIIVKKDGNYNVIANFSGTALNQGWVRIYKFSGDNVFTTRLTTGVVFYTGQAVWTGRLVANESIGMVHIPSVSNTDNADGAFGSQHDFTITRLGN